MGSKSVSQILSEFVYSLKLDRIPSEVVDRAKIHMLDVLGIMIAMHDRDENVRRVVKIVRSFGGNPESVVIGHRIRVPAVNAVLANSSMAHSADYDDTHLAAIVHPSSAVVPTTLAVGEALGASGRDVLEACIAGYEVGIRVSLAALRRLHERGFHPTSVVGVFGAAAAAAKLMGLDAEGISNAMGIAGSMASGIMQGHREGVWLKPLHPAIASHSGVLAAMMAREGIVGPRMVLEGRWGFFNAYLWGEEPYLDRVVGDLWKRWEILSISIKPYPVGHAAVAPIDLAIAFKEKYNLKPEDIREITFYMPNTAKELVCEPWEQRVRPKNPYEARFSVPFLAILALRKGWVSLWDFSWEGIGDHAILSHTEKVKCVHDPRYDAYEDEAVIPARARLVTIDGKVYVEEVINHRGSPKNPFTWRDAEKKFHDNTSNTRFSSVSSEIARALGDLEKLNTKDLASMLF